MLELSAARGPARALARAAPPAAPAADEPAAPAARPPADGWLLSAQAGRLAPGQFGPVEGADGALHFLY